jgi:hypothetical protein
MDRRTLATVRIAISDASGFFKFEYLNTTIDFLVMGVDDDGVYQPKAVDFLRAT